MIPFKLPIHSTLQKMDQNLPIQPTLPLTIMEVENSMSPIWVSFHLGQFSTEPYGIKGINEIQTPNTFPLNPTYKYHLPTPPTTVPSPWTQWYQHPTWEDYHL